MTGCDNGIYLPANPGHAFFKGTHVMVSMFLLDSLTLGGSEKKTTRLANALIKHGHELHVGYLNNPDSLKGDINPEIPLRFFNRKNKFEFRIVANLRRYIIANGITNLLCINLYPSLYGMLCKKWMKDGNLNIYIFINITDFQKLKEHLQMLLYRYILRMSSGIVFGCRRQQVEWSSRYVLPRDRCSVIYNGVDCSFFSPEALEEDSFSLREKLGFSRQDVVIVNVAEFRPEKKQEDLLRACEVLYRQGYPIRLVLVGDGPGRKHSEQLARELGIERIVHFRGRVKDVRPALSAADIFALPSVAVETFSNAALEAMAMGRPVVLTDIGGAAEMVSEGVNGFLVPPGDTSALVEKLEILVTDKAARKTMGERARELVGDRFSFEAMLEQYEKLLASPPIRPGVFAPPARGRGP